MNKLRLGLLLVLFLGSSFSTFAQKVVAVKDSIISREDSVLKVFVQSNDTLDRAMGCLINEVILKIQAKNGQVIRNADIITFNYTPSSSFFGSDSFQYQLKGCNGDSSLAWVYLSIFPINQPPKANPDYYTVLEESTSMFDVQKNDTDREGSQLSTTMVFSNLAKNGNAIVPSVNQIRYKPNINFFGKDSFKYKICDGSTSFSTSLCDETWVYITIKNVNDTLILSKLDTTVSVYQRETICVPVDHLVTDVDNENNWKSSISKNGANGTASVSNRKICYTSNAGFIGKDTVVVNICDDSGVCVKYTIYVNVSKNPNNIKALNDTILVVKNQSNTFSPEDNDANSSTISELKEVTKPANGTSVLNGSDVTYTPNPNFIGKDSQLYEIIDNLGNKDTAKIYYYIGISPTKPLAIDDYYELTPNSVTTLNVMLNDWPSDYPCSISTHTQPRNMTATLHPNGKWVIVTNGNFTGKDTFSYIICNTLNQCDTAVVILNSYKDAKTYAKIDTTYLQYNNNGTKCLDSLIKNMKKPYSFSVHNTTSQNTFTLNSNGCWTYNFPQGYEGIDSFVFIVCDNSNPVLCDTALHYIVVTIPKDVTIYNAVSPNNDRKNDHFTIQDIGYTSQNKLLIFNRWGDIIYTVDNYKNDWGEGHPDGVYFYKFEYVINGKSLLKTGYIYLNN
jgi:gliding motility-associated-like protein